MGGERRAEGEHEGLGASHKPHTEACQCSWAWAWAWRGLSVDALSRMSSAL
jgi:hypothetical protein